MVDSKWNKCLSELDRLTLGALVTIDVHNRDVIQSIIDENSPGPLLVPGTDASIRTKPVDDSDDHAERNAAQ